MQHKRQLPDTLEVLAAGSMEPGGCNKLLS